MHGLILLVFFLFVAHADCGFPFFAILFTAYVFLHMLGTTKNAARANWNHQMKLYLIGLLKQYDVPRFRTNNAWSKEAWTSMVAQFNSKFSFIIHHCSSKTKGARSKKGVPTCKRFVKMPFWDGEINHIHTMMTCMLYMMVSFSICPYLCTLVVLWFKNILYIISAGRYAEGRSCHGMDHYVNKAKQSSEVPTS